MALDFPVITIEECKHAGDLEKDWVPQQSHQSSLEAFCLSVSEFPDDWKSIAEIDYDAPVWTLSRAGAQFLDVLSLTEPQLEKIKAWGIENGLVKLQELWRAWETDGETGEAYYTRHNDLQTAERNAGLEPGETENEEDETWIEREPDAIVLTEEGMDALIRWSEPRNGLDGLIILYTDRVIRQINPDICGLWWDETYDPDNLSCPRGGILPDALKEFKISAEHEVDDEVCFGPSL
jgi:hypothetical protein